MINGKNQYEEKVELRGCSGLNSALQNLCLSGNSGCDLIYKQGLCLCN